jgi:hypothetical protein
MEEDILNMEQRIVKLARLLHRDDIPIIIYLDSNLPYEWAYLTMMITGIEIDISDPEDPHILFIAPKFGEEFVFYVDDFEYDNLFKIVNQLEELLIKI